MNIRRPRHGSLQYWPRTKAKRIYPRLKNQPTSKNLSVLGFAGYKAGMTHLMVLDNRPKSLTKGEEIFCPVSIIECPPMKV
ncbi:MAG: 50S ribosomal protein L3P, partial [Parcubacteria group bacterium GW2011_GWE2_43_12]